MVVNLESYVSPTLNQLLTCAYNCFRNLSKIKDHEKNYFLSTNRVDQILREVEFSIFLLAKKFSTAVTQQLVKANLNLNC